MGKKPANPDRNRNVGGKPISKVRCSWPEYWPKFHGPPTCKCKHCVQKFLDATLDGSYVEPQKVQRKSKKPVQDVRKQPKKEPRINSRNKGAGGEREFAKVLTDAGFKAERGQQHSGGKDSPDVRCEGLTNVHFEVKRVQSG